MRITRRGSRGVGQTGEDSRCTQKEGHDGRTRCGESTKTKYSAGPEQKREYKGTNGVGLLE